MYKSLVKKATKTTKKVKPFDLNEGIRDIIKMIDSTYGK